MEFISIPCHVAISPLPQIDSVVWFLHPTPTPTQCTYVKMPLWKIVVRIYWFQFAIPIFIRIFQYYEKIFAILENHKLKDKCWSIILFVFCQRGNTSYDTEVWFSTIGHFLHWVPSFKYCILIRYLMHFRVFIQMQTDEHKSSTRSEQDA